MKDLYTLAANLKFQPKQIPYSPEYNKFLWMCELQRWLREVHSTDVEITRGGMRGDWYCGYRKFGYRYNWVNSAPFKSYEDALETGLQEALKLIK